MSNAKWDTRKYSGEFDISYTKNPDGGSTWGIEQIQAVLLADIRRELRTLNRLLGCVNFVKIPHTLKAIEKNTKKRKYVRKVKV